jgi:hypothetical protein
MGALEFIAAGVRFEYGDDAALHVRGRVTPTLRAQLAAEIARRAPLVATVVPRPSGARWGQCDTCGDPLAPHVGGMCWLCVAARRQALRRAT